MNTTRRLGFVAIAVLTLAQVCSTASEAPSAPAKTMELTFESGGLKLKGTLTIPATSGKHASVLLIPGSGPTDRDGNQPPALKTDVLKQIAERLASEGIASFRFDKRACAVNKEQWPKDFATIAEFFSWENHILDATNAYACMKARPEVDSARCAILGHSEGGILTLSISDKAKPKAAVFIGTPGRNLMTVIGDQISRMAKIQGAPDDLVQNILKENKAIQETIVTTGKAPEKMFPGLAPLYNPSAVRMLQGVFRVEPCNVAKTLKMPALIINGQMDVQISAEKDAKPLFAAFQSRPGGSQDLFIVPSASHCLKKVSKETDPGFEGPMVPESLDKIAVWLKAKL